MNTASKKRQLADEIDQAAASAVWPDELVADQDLKDQAIAAGCKPLP